MSTPANNTDLSGPPSALDRAANGASVEAGQLRCLLCSGTEHRTVFTELDVDILRCANCGHVFSSFRADPHYADFWGSDVPAGAHYYWSKARARMHGAFFQRFITGRSGRLLDMGSGLGFFVKAMAAHPSWEAHGCEISPAAVKYAREQLGLKNVVCTRLQDAELPAGSFDIVTMWDVIDHILHPDPLLSRCHSLLKQDGVLFIRTPNVPVQLLRARVAQALGAIRADAKYLQASDHAHYYSAPSIRRLLERNGFADVALIHLPPIETGEGWRGAFVNLGKNATFQLLRALAVCSGGRLNFDNLFVVARKGAAAPSP
jgi:2-polyprenyl-3-methyl-5-hydroxy-6-metoxy-1,4-benzoquinol methylase